MLIVILSKDNDYAQWFDGIGLQTIYNYLCERVHSVNPPLDDCDFHYQFYDHGGMPKFHSVSRHLSEERYDLTDIYVHHRGSYTGASSNGQLCFLHWWYYSHLGARDFH